MKWLCLAIVAVLFLSVGAGCGVTKETIKACDSQEKRWRLAEKELVDDHPSLAVRKRWKENVAAFIYVLRRMKADMENRKFDRAEELKKLGIKKKGDN